MEALGRLQGHGPGRRPERDDGQGGNGRDHGSERVDELDQEYTGGVNLELLMLYTVMDYICPRILFGESDLAGGGLVVMGVSECVW